jgi:hypothetical protein
MTILARLLHHLSDTCSLVAHEAGSNVVQAVLQLAAGWLVGQ